MGPAPVAVSEDTACTEVVRLMREHVASSVVVKDEHNRLAGIVTEQDVVRRMAFNTDSGTPVREAMTAPVETIDSNDYLYRGLALMRRTGLRHMPVIDSGGEIVGVLQQHEALAAATEQMLGQVDRLTHGDTLDGMKHTKSAQANVAEELFRDRIPTPEIQYLITDINNDLYRRITVLCIREMDEEGWGPPPVEFEVLVMGSGGRGESFMNPDQDNGFVLDAYPDGDHERIDRWFVELAERMTKALNGVGFELCPGHVMATNPLWRKTLPQWKKQVDYWVNKSSGTVLRLGDIFFDLVSVFGSGDLARELRRHVTITARRPFFLREMYKVNEEHGVGLGLFGHLQVDREPGPNRGKINLKMTGTLPLVGAVRLFALREGIALVSTRERIQALHEQGILDRDEHDYLLGAFRHITNLLLRQQIRDFNAGQPVSKHVAPEDLTRRDRDMLVDSFKAIRKFRQRLRTELTGEIF